MLCDICQKQEATTHETHCINTEGGAPKQRHWCEECYEASNPSQAHELTTALRAGCRYCGGEPYTGSGHSLDGLGGTMKLSFMCKPCAEEYFSFLSQRMPGFGSETLTEEEIAKIVKCDRAAIFTEATEHMKKFVAERRAR
jgi:hypothetical protein